MFNPDYIGKKGYTSYRHFAGLAGIIEENPDKTSRFPYFLRFGSGFKLRVTHEELVVLKDKGAGEFENSK